MDADAFTSRTGGLEQPMISDNTAQAPPEYSKDFVLKEWRI